MKRNLLLYGLVFSVLINIFQMVNSSNILKRSEEVSTISKKELKKANKYDTIYKNAYYARYKMEKRRVELRMKIVAFCGILCLLLVFLFFPYRKEISIQQNKIYSEHGIIPEIVEGISKSDIKP